MRIPVYLRLAVLAAALYLGWVFAGRYVETRAWMRGRAREAAPANADFERIYGGTEVRILQFYAPSGSVIEGSRSTICYGVVNARAVRIEPPIEGVSPSLNRCVEVAPGEDTRYTLTAEGSDGRVVSESFLLQVKADPATLPVIGSFQVADHKIDRGRHVFLLTFSAANADTIDIDPPVFPTLRGAPNGRFYVNPGKTTTYTLTATGKKGRQVRKQVTVEVPAS
ncbi:MAG TPA: hypothetical protein VN442_04030 [Bryobacteraceae bacterium]|nr:hypothetical protein [Bryobacteraceae bacterium]